MRIFVLQKQRSNSALIVPRGTPQNKFNIMHTTDTTAAPFRVDAIYNPAIDGIYYDIQIDGNTARLRDQFGRIGEALEIVESIEYNHEGQPEPFKFIDPNGYSICLFDLTYTTQQPPFICSVCGETKQVPKGSGGTGYGVNRDTGAKTCYECIGREDELNLLSMKPRENTRCLLYHPQPRNAQMRSLNQIWRTMQTHCKNIRPTLRHSQFNRQTMSKTSNTEPCHACNGTGRNQYDIADLNLPEQKCITCNGTGKVPKQDTQEK